MTGLAWILPVGCSLLAGPAAGQGLRTPAPPDDAPITVTAQVRHVTAIVLPEAAEIVEVVVGDAEHWDVSASAHLAFVRPLAEGAHSNAVLLTAAGAIVPLALVESAESAVDAVVRIGLAAAGAVDLGSGVGGVRGGRDGRGAGGRGMGGDGGARGRTDRGSAGGRAGQARRGPRGVLPAGAVRLPLARRGGRLPVAGRGDVARRPADVTSGRGPSRPSSTSAQAAGSVRWRFPRLSTTCCTSSRGCSAPARWRLEGG